MVTEMTQVWERLFVGGRHDAEHLSFINPCGMTSVISLCEAPIVLRAKGINYVHIQIEDESPIPVGQFDRVMDAIAENLRWGTVLVHCGGGVSRAPILTAAWMHIVGYRNIDASLFEIKKLRPVIEPSPVLLESVKEHL